MGDCGKRGIQITDQFVADQVENVAIKDYPWSVAIIKETSEDNFIIHCSGSILNNRWILTAGHCFDDLKENAASKLKIKLGTDDWGEVLDDYELQFSTQQDHELENFFVHPKYSDSNHYYDVALIKTQEDISFNEAVQPICLPITPSTDPDNRKNDKVEVAGFGFASSDIGLCTDSENTQLWSTSLSIWGYKFCNNSIGADNVGSIKAEWLKAKFPKGFQSNIICAGSDKKWNKICPGDSGAPLVVFEQNIQGGYFEQVAVTGGEVKFTEVGFYARLYDAEVLNWIKEIAFNETIDTPEPDVLPSPDYIDSPSLNSTMFRVLVVTGLGASRKQM